MSLSQFTDEELRDELTRRERSVTIRVKDGTAVMHLPHSPIIRMVPQTAVALRDLLANVTFCGDDTDYEGWQEVPRSVPG